MFVLKLKLKRKLKRAACQFSYGNNDFVKATVTNAVNEVLSTWRKLLTESFIMFTHSFS